MKRNPEYLIRQTADSTVIVPVGKAAINFPGMIVVNETGARLWELLEQDRTEEELFEALYQKFDVPPQRMRDDLTEFLKRLRLVGAVVESGPAEGEQTYAFGERGEH